MLAAMSALLFVSSRILHRRRELYTEWLLRKGLPIVNTPGEQPGKPSLSAGNTDQ